MLQEHLTQSDTLEGVLAYIFGEEFDENTLEEIVQSFPSLLTETPEEIYYDFIHGITLDLPQIIAKEQQEEFEKQFETGLLRLGIDPTDKKQRVYQTKIVKEGNDTIIQFQREKDSIWESIHLEGITIQQGEPRLGGGGRNLLQTVEGLMKAFQIFSPHIKKDHPLQQGRNKKMIAKMVSNDTPDSPFENIKIQTLAGTPRESFIFPFKGSPFYFTQKEARIDNSEEEGIASEIQNTRSKTHSLVLQQLPIDRLKNIVEKTEEKRIFLLVPTEFIKLGIDDPLVESTLSKTETASLNLEEAAIFLGKNPEKIHDRKAFAQEVANTLHKKEVENVIITDAEKGSYVSHRYGDNVEWQHFDIDSDIKKYVTRIPKNLRHEEINATGCGDSFAATIQFCQQVLGARNWNFIVPLARKIAGVVLHLKQASIQDVPSEIIAEIFLDAFRQRKRPHEGWEIIQAIQDVTQNTRQQLQAVRA